MIGRKTLVVSLLAIIFVGCTKSDSDSSGSSGNSSGGAKISKAESEARDAAMTEVNKRWAKAADGWITAKFTGTSFAGEHYLREAREIAIEGVQVEDLTESDKLNGIEWAGKIQFKSTPCREAGDSGMVLEGMGGLMINRPRGKWSQWLDMTPEAIRMLKVKGQWKAHEDTWLLRGTMPTPADFANAGVK
jgi:hypothetical protein